MALACDAAATSTMENGRRRRAYFCRCCARLRASHPVWWWWWCRGGAHRLVLPAAGLRRGCGHTRSRTRDFLQLSSPQESSRLFCPLLLFFSMLFGHLHQSHKSQLTGNQTKTLHLQSHESHRFSSSARVINQTTEKSNLEEENKTKQKLHFWIW